MPDFKFQIQIPDFRDSRFQISDVFEREVPGSFIRIDAKDEDSRFQIISDSKFRFQRKIEFEIAHLVLDSRLIESVRNATPNWLNVKLQLS